MAVTRPPGLRPHDVDPSAATTRSTGSRLAAMTRSYRRVTGASLLGRGNGSYPRGPSPTRGLACPGAGLYRLVMKISDVLRNKGDGVVTVGPDETVARLLEVLAEHGIGAVVVSGDGRAVDGIVSERDVVRHLHRDGVGVVDGPVSAIMTRDVATAESDEELEALARTMTERRIRHVPVTVDGVLHSIVSIGDVVKLRIDTLQSERDQLVGYIQQ
ncbi:hypothetical protein GCM10009814_13590 [Lapillicoccus jejuensis]